MQIERARFVVVAALLLGLFFAPQANALSVPRRLDGVPVKPGQENRWVVGVMIDNAPDARPQSGLGRAGVVYETLAEGGVPRFLALFSAPLPGGRIGPVRSVRPYFADYAAEYRAAVAHAGGSADGLRAIDRDRLHSINGLKGLTARAFFRVGGYTSTHNLYTNGALLNRDLARVHLDQRHPSYAAWKFSSDPPLAKRPKRGAGLHIDFRSGKSFIVDFRYNRTRNAFERSTGGRVQRDGPGGPILAAKNVLVLMVPKERVLDRKGRLDISILGRGKGILLKNGTATTVRWSKDAPSHRTVITTLDGRPIVFTRGSTWIEVVPAGRPVRVL